MTDDPRPQESDIPDEPEEPKEPAEPAEPVAAVEEEPATTVVETAPAPEPVPEPVPEFVPVPVRSYRKVVGIGSAAYAAVAIAVAVLVMVPFAPRVFGSTPTDRVLTAADGLARAPEVHYTGATLGGALRLDVRSENDGTGVGTVVSYDGGKASLLTVSGTTYTKGDRNWWLAQKAVDTGIYAGHWMTDGSLHFDATTLLRPTKLAAAIRKGLQRDPVLPGGSGHAVTKADGDVVTELHGTAVDAYRTRSRLTVYVTRDTPYRVVGVDGDLTALGGSGAGTFAIDLGLGSTADRTRLSGDVRTASKGLDADKDPAEPAEYSPTAAAGNQVSCDENGCGESVEVENTGDGAPKGQGYLLGLFSAEKPAGQALGTCRAPIPALQPSATARVTCSISTPAWKAWAATGGGSYRFDSYAFSPGWDGDDPGTIAKLLAFASLRDTDGIWATPTEAAQTLATLLGTKGWTAQKAVDTVHTLVSLGEIGAVHDLLASGKFTTDPATLSTANPEALTLAAQLVRAGSGGVAVGSWVGPGATTYYGDVLDLGAHQVVQLVDDSGGSLSALIVDIQKAADGFASNAVPTGFSKRVRLSLDTTDPLYRQDKTGLRAALKRQGMTADKLNGADLVVVTGYGTVTLTGGDLR